MSIAFLLQSQGRTRFLRLGTCPLHCRRPMRLQFGGAGGHGTTWTWLGLFVAVGTDTTLRTTQLYLNN